MDKNTLITQPLPHMVPTQAIEAQAIIRGFALAPRLFYQNSWWNRTTWTWCNRSIGNTKTTL